MSGTTDYARKQAQNDHQAGNCLPIPKPGPRRCAKLTTRSRRGCARSKANNQAGEGAALAALTRFLLPANS